MNEHKIQQTRSESLDLISSRPPEKHRTVHSRTTLDSATKAEHHSLADQHPSRRPAPKQKPPVGSHSAQTSYSAMGMDDHRCISPFLKILTKEETALNIARKRVSSTQWPCTNVISHSATLRCCAAMSMAKGKCCGYVIPIDCCFSESIIWRPLLSLYYTRFPSIPADLHSEVF